MANFYDTFAYGVPLAYWAVGVTLSSAWLSRKTSGPRIALLVISILWPFIVLLYGFHEQSASRDMAVAFVKLCQNSSYEKIYNNDISVDKIHIDYGVYNSPFSYSWTFAKSSYMNKYIVNLGEYMASRLVLDSPGYNVVYSIRHKDDGEIDVKTDIRRSYNDMSVDTQSKLTESDVARYGIRFVSGLETSGQNISQYKVEVYDRLTGNILGEQVSYVYYSERVSFAGHLLWNEQLRSCPLTHTMDFLRAVLAPPQGDMS